MRSFKRIFCIICIICLALFLNSINVYAVTDTSDTKVSIKLTTETPNFNVVVPTSIPIHLNSDGSVIEPKGLKIINNSVGPIKVSNIEIKGEGDWVKDIEENIVNWNVDEKKFTMDITVDTSLNITTSTNIALQSTIMSNIDIASVIFTVEWNKDKEPIYEDTIYNISYNLDDGNLTEEYTNPSSYTIKDAVFTLKNPTREGYIFAGWTGTDLSEMTYNVTVNTASAKDLSFVANWLLDANKDGIADKYQVTLIYKAGSNGKVTPELPKVITLRDENGNLVEYLEGQIPGVDGIVVTADNGYTTNGWDKSPLISMTYVGGETYTFTALFRSVSTGGGGGGGRPSIPSESFDETL